MRIALALAIAPALVGQNLIGPLTYAKGGVEMAGRTIPWKDIASLEERNDVAAEYAASKQDDKASVQFDLGRWCRERGLDAEADPHSSGRSSSSLRTRVHAAHSAARRS